MDPVSQVLAQQQSGSAGGQGFGQFYVEGQRQGLARRKLDLEARQEARMQTRDDLMLPLEAQLAQAQVVNLGIQAQLNTDKAQSLMQLNMVLPEIFKLESAFAQSPDGFADKGLIAQASQLAARYPRAFAKGMPGGDLLTNIQAVPMLQQQIRRAEDMVNRLQPGQSMNVPGVGSVSVDPARAGAMPGTLSTVGKEVADLTALERADPAAAQRFREAQAQRDASRNVATTVTTNPDGTVTTSFTRGPQAGTPTGLTTGTLSKVQEKSLNIDSALGELDKLSNIITTNPNAFGLRGVGGELLETAQGVINPAAEAETTRARHQAALTFTQIADSLRVDSGNMSLYERRKLEEVGDVTDLWTHASVARDKVNNIRDMLVARKLRLDAAAQKAPAEAFLRRIRPNELAPLIQENLLSAADAVRWHKARRQNP